jgi:hypothetical protein
MSLLNTFDSLQLRHFTLSPFTDTDDPIIGQVALLRWLKSFSKVVLVGIAWKVLSYW